MKYKYQPKTKAELIEAIKKEIYEIQRTKDNPNWQADLNCIDTSLITDMSYLFSEEYGLNKFNGDISNWNVSNVTDMSRMFDSSQFNGDISNWNVSNIENIEWMFAHSQFNGDISNWDVSNVENMESMFAFSQFNGDISDWEVSNVTNMKSIFFKSKFNKDISDWNVSNVKDMSWMFAYSKFNRDISKWDISNVENMEWMFLKSKFNQDISSWPLKKDTGLKNISVFSEYNRLPDKIVFSETVENILQNKEILYKSETVAKLFLYSLKNKNKNFNFKIFFKDYLNNRKELYESKGYKSNIANKLVLNDITEILKYLKDKNMQKRFMEIMIKKDGKEPDINLD